jgi:outer membrane protein TolC
MAGSRRRHRCISRIYPTARSTTSVSSSTKAARALLARGQRRAVQAIAESATAASAAATAALQLEVVGLLRGGLWDVEAATNNLAAARDTVTVAEELLRAVERRHARGDLPLADVLLARVALLERKQAVVTAAANLVDTERSYYSLTGLDRRPAMFAEQARENGELAPNPLWPCGLRRAQSSRPSSRIGSRAATSR